VFDPLAVMLVIAYNQALIDRNKKILDDPAKVASIIAKDASAKTQTEHWRDIYSEPVGFSGLVEDDERMDIIGQNGNDGLHYDVTDQDLINDEDLEPREENDPQRPTLKGGVKII
jgi:hypothetical protein